MKKHLWLIGVAAFLLAIDFWLKAWVHRELSSSMLIPIFTGFSSVKFFLVHATNIGAAFGLFTSLQSYIMVVRLVAVVAFITYLFMQAHPLPKRAALYLLLTGTLGNSIDYFLYGHVVDMFLVTFGPYHYPVFNLADSLICMGASLLLISSFRLRHARTI